MVKSIGYRTKKKTREQISLGKKYRVLYNCTTTSYETWLAILHIAHFFIFLKCFKRVGSVLSSPELHVDSIFYVLLCTSRVRTLKRAKPL